MNGAMVAALNAIVALLTFALSIYCFANGREVLGMINAALTVANLVMLVANLRRRSAR